MGLNLPTKNFRHDKIQFSNGLEIEIVHNMADREGITNSLYAAAHNWLIRTTLTPNKHQREALERDFANYINDKGIHQAYTVSQYEELTGTDLIQTNED